MNELDYIDLEYEIMDDLPLSDRFEFADTIDQEKPYDDIEDWSHG